MTDRELLDLIEKFGASHSIATLAHTHLSSHMCDLLLEDIERQWREIEAEILGKKDPNPIQGIPASWGPPRPLVRKDWCWLAEVMPTQYGWYWWKEKPEMDPELVLVKIYTDPDTVCMFRPIPKFLELEQTTLKKGVPFGLWWTGGPLIVPDRPVSPSPASPAPPAGPAGYSAVPGMSRDD